MSPRWEPSKSTVASMSTSSVRWHGTVLNISEGGGEIQGLPPGTVRPGCMLTVKIDFETHTVEWAGRMMNSRRGTHVVAFNGASSLPETCCTCVCCLETIAWFGSPLLDADEVFMCSSCEERATEKLGYDFTYEELGWG